MEKLKNLLLAKSIGLYINFLSYAHPKKAGQLAYRFFSEPRLGRLSKESLPLVLQHAKTETFNHNGQQIQAYIWKGNNNIILLVHGWESNASRWEKMLPYLRSSGSTIIAIDGPAHGLSSGVEFNVPAYAEYIDFAVQKFNPNILIGHSIGGAACIYYQYKYQSTSLQKMVILGAPSDLKTLVQNYVALLSLNAKIVTMLENHFIERFKFKLDDFSGKIFGSALSVKGMIAHDIHDDVVSFEEAKKSPVPGKPQHSSKPKALGTACTTMHCIKKSVTFCLKQSDIAFIVIRPAFRFNLFFVPQKRISTTIRAIVDVFVFSSGLSFRRLTNRMK
ncbi:MAG TPA: alpha/beta hydrolase [Flavobacterium sp.]|nr:alpha/beta hydrolase [Flavobacterium sp.]